MNQKPQLDDAEILFRRIKAELLKHPTQSERFKHFALMQTGRPGWEFHHVCASLGSLKSDGHFGVAVSPLDHKVNQDNRGWLIEKLPQAIGVLRDYAVMLEKESEEQQETIRILTEALASQQKEVKG